MAFPKTFLGIAIGWSKRGNTGESASGRTGYIIFKIHSFCGTKVKIGIENGKSFIYCPKCMEKTKGFNE